MIVHADELVDDVFLYLFDRSVGTDRVTLVLAQPDPFLAVFLDKDDLVLARSERVSDHDRVSVPLERDARFWYDQLWICLELSCPASVMKACRWKQGKCEP